MRKNNKLALVVASFFLATLWGCGSNMDSGGDQTGPGTGIADAAKLGSDGCKVCHTTIAVTQNFNASVHDTADAGCEGCHGGGQFHKGIGEIPYPEPGPNQCTQCHTLSAIGHTDDPATPDVIEGLVVKTSEQGGCQACHYNDHNPVLTINEEWAKSGHGGFIATGPVTETTAAAWVDYDWDAANRASCQRCHTSTGISNFLNDPTTYNSANNDYSHLAGWTSTNKISGQQEVLYCWGCHSDVASGTIRNPGARTEVYAGSPAGSPSVEVDFVDVKESNLCIGCHVGREVGEVIKESKGDFSNLSFINSHYLAAAPNIFNVSGYEYGDVDYQNYGFHQNIGINNTFNTGYKGPCVTCHMSVGSGHTFVFFEKDAEGAIIEIKSTFCSNCHISMTPETLESVKEKFYAAADELRLELLDKGIEYSPNYPYFYVEGTTTAFKNWDSVYPGKGKDVMGAAFNYNLIISDPCSYAHNNDYALKLIADSIDFLIDGTIDGDTSLASTLIGQGINLDSGAGYSPIHDAPVATAILAPQTSGATCSVCHAAAPHYGGGIGQPQWVNSTVTTCSVCHASDSLATNQLIISQYAHSGHGDVRGIWTADEANSNATSPPATNTSNCQRCHTTSGYIASISNTTYAFPAAPNAARYQTLNCNGCHPTIGDGTATFPAVGAFSVTWSSGGVTQLFTFPDASTSNLCIRCHSGRRGGPQITNSYVYAHYLPAAAGLYGHYVDAGDGINNPTGIGYEFIGRAGAGAYADIPPHTVVGLDNLNGTGNNGPCVACHMSGTAGHTWAPLTKDHTTGAISSINSGACNLCHNGTSAFVLDESILQQIYNKYDAARNVLKLQLEALGLYYNPDNHYYYRDAGLTTYVMGGQTAADYVYVDSIITANPALTGPVGTTRKDLLGAAYNYGYLSTIAFDAAAYVHNPTYAKRLLFDSIDFLDNGILNGTISVTGDAASYLDGDPGTTGVQRP